MAGKEAGPEQAGSQAADAPGGAGESVDGLSAASLGTLKRVNVRQAWEHEARNFTPWLEQNLDRLAAVLGIAQLDPEGTEVRVGPYWADIVASVPHDGTRVLIENQLEPADLQHLGQVLAYLAGLEAQIVVWIATAFDEAHISAIRWLNEHTTDPFAFFAVRVSVVQIGDSQLAPVFDVLERPNEWERRIQNASRRKLTETGIFRRDFWAHFVSKVSDAPSLRPDYAASSIWYPVEESNLQIVLYLAYNSVGVFLRGERNEPDTDVLKRIEPFVARLAEATNDEDLRRGQNPWCQTQLTIDSHDRSNWNQMADWLDKQRRVYARALQSSPKR